MGSSGPQRALLYFEKILGAAGFGQARLLEEIMVVVAQADDAQRILHRRAEFDLFPLEYEPLAGSPEIRTAAALGMIEGRCGALPGTFAAGQKSDAVGGDDGRRQGLVAGLPLPGEQVLIGKVQIDDPLFADHRPEAISPFGVLIHHNFHDSLLLHLI